MTHVGAPSDVSTVRLWWYTAVQFLRGPSVYKYIFGLF